MITKGMMSCNSNEWATPVKFFEELNNEFNDGKNPAPFPSMVVIMNNKEL